MKVLNEMKLGFLSRSVNEGFARVAVSAFAAQLDPTVEELGELRTAVSEAVTNAVVHAYEDRLGPVSVRARILEGNIVEVCVGDRGRGIEDIERARAPMFTTCSTGERSGMGFTIMESFCDSVRVRSAPGKGTRVTMRKTLSAKE